VLTGLAVSIACTAYSRKFLPLSKISNVSIPKLFSFLLYLFLQIYLAGFFVMKMILFGKPRADILETHTTITNRALRVILADSVTLTPGSVLLDLSEDKITVVMLRDKRDAENPENADELIKGGLEKKLLKAQKAGVT